MYALMFAYLPMILALVAGMIGAAGYFTYWFFGGGFLGGYLLLRLGVFVIVLDLAVLLSSLILLIGLLPLLFREVTDETPGIRLTRERHPNLFGLLDRISRRLGSRPPDECFLSPFDGAWIADRSVVDDDGTVRHNVRTLCLGAVEVIETPVDQFGTLLGHEMAHAATGDTRLSCIASRFFNSMQLAIEGHSDDDRTWVEFLVYCILVGYYRLFSLFYLSDGRARELRADRLAAAVFGPQCTRQMLIRVHRTGYLPKLSIQSVVMDFVQYGKPLENVYSEYVRRRRDMPRDQIEQAENEMFMEESSIWSTHPRLADRIRSLSEIHAKEWSVSKPARLLFDNWLALETKMTEYLVEYAGAAHAAHMQAVNSAIRSVP